MSYSSSMALCPVNFLEFNKMHKQLNNLEACLLFLKIKFYEKHTKITKSGISYIARSRSEIAEWFSFSEKKVDRLLSFLEQKGFIKKHTSLWYGKKKLFITTTCTLNEEIPVNFKLLNHLMQKTGSLNSALIFARIAFALANSKIHHKNLTWCCLKKEQLAVWSGCCIRTVDTILACLIKKGLLLKQNLTWRGRAQSHFHIPKFVTNIFKNIHKNCLAKSKDHKIPYGVKFTHTQNCRLQSAKSSISINKETNKKKINNNTDKSSSDKHNQNVSDIIFNKIGNTLNSRQTNYLKGAFNNTIIHRNLTITNPKEVWEQIKFSILNAQQHKGISIFKHVVSRCMKILAEGNWKTPIGFYNHSEKGRALKSAVDEKRNRWEKQKREEIDVSQNQCLSITSLLNQYTNQNEQDDCSKTKEALMLAEQLLRIETLVYKLNEEQKPHYLAHFDSLTTKIYELIRSGANKKKIMMRLKSGVSCKKLANA